MRRQILEFVELKLVESFCRVSERRFIYRSVDAEFNLCSVQSILSIDPVELSPEFV